MILFSALLGLLFKPLLTGGANPRACGQFEVPGECY
jgi:hypothetical protein